MKPLTNSGGLVDKKEQMLFEAYKNKVMINAEVFRKEIKRDYGFEPSSELFRKITNYQIKKYGCALSIRNTGARDYVPRFHLKSKKVRKKHDDLCVRKLKEKRLIERVERKKRNASK